MVDARAKSKLQPVAEELPVKTAWEELNVVEEVKVWLSVVLEVATKTCLT